MAEPFVGKLLFFDDLTWRYPLMKLLTTWVREIIVAGSFFQIVTLCGLAPLANAAGGTGQFLVTATLQNFNSILTPNAGFCFNSTDLNGVGGTSMIVCATGTAVNKSLCTPWVPAQATDCSAQSQINCGGQTAIVDDCVGLGKSMSLRMIELSDFSYLEMLVNW